MAKSLEFVWEYLRPLLGIKNIVQFSIKIPHLTSTVQVSDWFGSVLVISFHVAKVFSESVTQSSPCFADV